MCVFVYTIDRKSQPAVSRHPMRFTEVYLGQVVLGDFRKNPRGELEQELRRLTAMVLPN